MKVILSYPRSGNHLVRFLIELLTEEPTLGCKENPKDKPIFLNCFPENVPFNILSLDDYNKEKLYIKYHTPPSKIEKPTELLFIIRNPREVLVRNLNYTFRSDGWDGCDTYFNCLDYFMNFDGKKQFFYYEDICTDRHKFINDLCSYLDIKNDEKKNYVIKNIDKLYEISKLGKNRIWGGVNSNNIHYYYDRLGLDEKQKFDNYINSKMKTNKYDFIKNKYNL